MDDISVLNLFSRSWPSRKDSNANSSISFFGDLDSNY